MILSRLPHPYRPIRIGMTAALVWSVLACNPPSASRGTECIAPANAGGGWDLTCRALTRVLATEKLIEGSARVINMPGAGGGVAFAHTVTQRTGDGNVVVAASPATTLRLAQRQYGRLTMADVRWVAAVAAEYGVLAVRADAAWPDLNSLLDAWGDDPTRIVFAGGSAMAGQDHMKVLLLADAAGFDPRSVRYVPFDGGGEAITALLGGFVHVFSGEASEVQDHLEAGAIRVLTILAPDRSPSLPEVPTARESGFPVEWITWRGFYMPADVTDEQYGRWVARFDTLAGSPTWAGIRAAYRLEPFLLTGADFVEHVTREVAAFERMSVGIGLRP